MHSFNRITPSHVLLVSPSLYHEYEEIVSMIIPQIRLGFIAYVAYIAKKVIRIQTSYDRIAFYAIKQMHHTNAIECVYEIFHIHANKYLNVVQNITLRDFKE